MAGLSSLESRLLAAALALAGAVTAATAGSAAPSPAVAALVVKVKANHLMNGSGKVVRLLGVDRSGAEYMCIGGSGIFDGPSDATSVKAIASWHVNAVRVPLNEDCWLGINGLSKTVSGQAYRLAIEQYVKTLQASGIYVILDLHWAAPGTNVARSQWPMADADHAPAFWKSVASAFKSNHGVLFDLFNEPYLSSWSCWEHGCRTTYSDNGRTVTYSTAGMQSLVNAVRSTGATTPLMLGGLQWSSDETRWRQYEPSDPLHQLVVSFHTYNFSGCNNVSCWGSEIAPLTKVVPVVTGEFGENGCKDAYDLVYMPWADAHGISYLGWTWNSTGPPSNWDCSGGPALIKNYRGTPTTYGAGLKAHLAQLAAQPTP